MTLSSDPLFHPLRNMWPKHFRTWKDIENIKDDYEISAVDLNNALCNAKFAF